MLRLLCCFILVIFLTALSAQADEIHFINGDRLTGTVVSMEMKRVKISTAMAGDITVPLSRIQRFSTTKPLTIVLEDRTTVFARVALYEAQVFYLLPPEEPSASAEQRDDPIPATLPAGEVAAIETPMAKDEEQVEAEVAQEDSTDATLPVESDLAKRLPPGVRRLHLDDVDTINPPTPRWRGSVSVGATANRGNTNSDLITGNFDIARRGVTDRIELRGSYNYGQERHPVTRREYTSIHRWNTSGEYDYFLDKRWYIYAGGGAESDKLKNLDLRLTPGMGLGYQWIETDRTKFSTEGGGAWVYEERSSPSSTDSYMAARLAWTVEHRVTDTVRFVHNFEILPRIDDPSDYVMKADAGLRFDLTGQIFAEIRATLSRDTTPAAGKRDTDTQYRALLGYRF